MRLTASCWLGSLEVFLGVTNRWLGLGGGALVGDPVTQSTRLGVGWKSMVGDTCSFFLGGFSVLKKLVEPTPWKSKTSQKVVAVPFG